MDDTIDELVTAAFEQHEALIMEWQTRKFSPEQLDQAVVNSPWEALQYAGSYMSPEQIEQAALAFPEAAIVYSSVLHEEQLNRAIAAKPEFALRHIRPSMSETQIAQAEAAISEKRHQQDKALRNLQEVMCDGNDEDIMRAIEALIDVNPAIALDECGQYMDDDQWIRARNADPFATLAYASDHMDEYIIDMLVNEVHNQYPHPYYQIDLLKQLEELADEVVAEYIRPCMEESRKAWKRMQAQG